MKQLKFRKIDIDTYKPGKSRIGNIKNLIKLSANESALGFSSKIKKNSFTLINFWASWCAPCRVENPYLVYLNTKYSKDEFQIIGVSLDRTREAWENAIKEDKLDDWIHISHLKFWNEPIAKLYNITQMPTSYVLNSEKKILAMNVKDQDLDNLIEEQLLNP